MRTYICSSLRPWLAGMYAYFLIINGISLRVQISFHLVFPALRTAREISTARHSEETVAMLIGPPETLRSCSPMLGETTPKNHSAVKKVVPKTDTPLSRGNRRIREIVFQCFRRVRETIARGVRLHLIRVVPIVAMCDSGVLFNTQGTQHTNTANTEHTQSKHTHTQTHRPTQSKHKHRHAHRDPQNSFTKPRLHKAQAHTHTY